MTRKHTILYAEDDLDDLFMVQQAFESFRHIEVRHARNGLEVVQELQQMVGTQQLPCLVILDINMPVMDGREALQKIKEDERLAPVPIVLFSTSSSQTDLDFASRWNVLLETKPLSFSDLELIARRFVDQCNFEVNSVLKG